MSKKFKNIEFGEDMMTASEVQSAISTACNKKQDKLTAGTGITIDSTGKISATGSTSVPSNITELLNEKQDKLTIDGSVNSTSTNPVQNKAVYTELAKKQDKLTAGSGISLNGSTISTSVDSALSDSSTNPVQNKVIKTEIEKKQDKLTAGTGITISSDGTISSTSSSSDEPDVVPLSTVSGYYDSNKFYEDSSLETEIEPTNGYLYRDLNSQKTYQFINNSYRLLDLVSESYVISKISSIQSDITSAISLASSIINDPISD